MARERARHIATIESVLDAHKWHGGYFCTCGYAVNCAESWARHILFLALDPDD